MTLLVAKTQFHTGKLKVVIGYGVPPGISWDQASNYESQVLDFDRETTMRKVLVPYNAETTWLKTFSGKLVTDATQDFVLATVNIFVQNQLVAPESVKDSVYINVIERFPDCELAVPRPLSFTETAWGHKPIETEGSFSYYSVKYTPPPVLPEMVAESAVTGDSGMPGTGVVEGGEATIAEPDSGQTTTTMSNHPEQNKPCKITTYNHFEYTAQTVEELGRRYARMSRGRDYMLWEAGSCGRVPPDGTEWMANIFGKPTPNQGPSNFTVLTIQVRPLHPLAGYYAGWKGSIHLRIFGGSTLLQENLYNQPKKDGDSVLRACFLPMQENAQRNALSFKPMDAVAYLVDGPVWQIMQPNQQDQSDPPVQWFSGMYSPETMYPAVEALFPNTDNKGFIDLLIPFQTIFNFLPMQEFNIGDSVTTIPVAVGQVQVLLPTHCNPEVYCAFGDDLKLGAFKGMHTTKRDMKIDTGDFLYPGGQNIQSMTP